MKQLLLLTLFFVCSSCFDSNNSTDPTQVESKITDDVVSQTNARAFIQEHSSDTPSSLKISQEDINSWATDGLISSEEAAELSKNL